MFYPGDLVALKNWNKPARLWAIVIASQPLYDLEEFTHVEYMQDYKLTVMYLQRSSWNGDLKIETRYAMDFLKIG